jgi:hypothetical protein
MDLCLQKVEAFRIFVHFIYCRLMYSTYCRDTELKGEIRKKSMSPNPKPQNKPMLKFASPTHHKLAIETDDIR